MATAASALAQVDPPHSFILTYRAFGPVSSTSRFQAADGYDLRFEGCYARHSEEAICGFTLRAKRPVVVSNIGNASQGSGASGAAMRTCCMFVQGDDRGYPIVKAATPPIGVAVLNRPLRSGEEIGLMLRIPDYRKAGVLKAIRFSRGQGDAGVDAPAHIVELP